MGSPGHVPWLGSVLGPSIMPGATLFIQCDRMHVLASDSVEVCAAALLWDLQGIYTASLSIPDVSSAFEPVESEDRDSCIGA